MAYRLLEEGEVIQEGDEYWVYSLSEWWATDCDGLIVEEYDKPYRRPITLSWLKEQIEKGE